MIWALALVAMVFGCEKAPRNNDGSSEVETPSEYFWHFSVKNVDAGWPIGVFVRDYKVAITNGEFHLDASTGASFEIKTDYSLSAGGKIYAYSPYAEGNDKHNALKLTIPTEQVSGAVPMPRVAVPVELGEPSQESTATLSFYDLAGSLEVKVYSTKSTGEKVSAIAFESSEPLAGSFVFNAKAADPNQASTVVISGYTEKKVSTTGSFVVDTDPDSAGSLTLVLAPGTYSGTMTVTTDVDTYGIVLEEPVTVVRGEKSSVTVRIAPRNDQDSSGNAEEFEGGVLETK